jgi:uncharacterized cofD-like protein
VKKRAKNDEMRIAVIGGGTGSFVILSALKKYTNQITALVNMADDGGNTGVLRDELGVLPPGDVRQCLVALSRNPKVRDLFNYRFEEGSLKGHSFGNLFLTALEKMTGDFSKGVSLASEVLSIIGQVEPITLTNVRLAMRLKGNKPVRGQFVIENCSFRNKNYPKLWLEPEAEANPKAIKAIKQADLVIVAPGNLYISLAPILIVSGVGKALKESQALKIYVCNLVTKPGQTDGFMVTDFANEIERLAGDKFLDAVLFNTEKPNRDLLGKYAKDGELSVEYNHRLLKQASYNTFGRRLLAGKVYQNVSRSDPMAAHRTLIRHDSEATARELIKIYKKYAKSN